MPEFSDMISSGKKGWTSWWAFNFTVAQSFQLMACFGHEFSYGNSKEIAINVMHIIATLAYFWVGVAHFDTGNKMSKKVCLIVGDVAYLCAMAVMSSIPGIGGIWQFGVGWGGFGCACIATAYYFMAEDEEVTHKKEDKLSSFFIYFAFICTWIGYTGYSNWIWPSRATGALAAELNKVPNKTSTRQTQTLFF